MIFRMPIEQRTSHALERQELLRAILVQLVANFLNVAPGDVDPTFTAP